MHPSVKRCHLRDNKHSGSRAKVIEQLCTVCLFFLKLGVQLLFFEPNAAGGTWKLTDYNLSRLHSPHKRFNLFYTLQENFRIQKIMSILSLLY